MKYKIRNIAELKAAKHKLEIQREASKQLFFDSIGQTRSQATHLLTQKILVPAGLAGLATWGAAKLFSSNGETETSARQASASKALTGELLRQLLPLGISLLTSYLKDRASEEA